MCSKQTLALVLSHRITGKHLNTCKQTSCSENPGRDVELSVGRQESCRQIEGQLNGRHTDLSPIRRVDYESKDTEGYQYSIIGQSRVPATISIGGFIELSNLLSNRVIDLKQSERSPYVR